MGILTPSRPPVQQVGKGTESPNLEWSFAVQNGAYLWGSLSPSATSPIPSPVIQLPNGTLNAEGHLSSIQEA